MQLQAVTGAGMVEIPRGTEAFHWLALVMKQHSDGQISWSIP
jgi:hypothetical protein